MTLHQLLVLLGGVPTFFFHRMLRCWCSDLKLCCPVHVLGKFFRSLTVGSMPFHIHADKARQNLRELLRLAGIPKYECYATHDIRRGHADDLRKSGTQLNAFLRAGEWTSAAFRAYLDEESLWNDAIHEAHEDDSEVEG